MSIIRGKALLVIRGLESGYTEVTAYIRTASGGPYAKECAKEDLTNSTWLPMPVNVRENETVRVYVVYVLQYSTDYYGEVDVSVDYEKIRVLRRQQSRDFYISKKEMNRDLAASHWQYRPLLRGRFQEDSG